MVEPVVRNLAHEPSPTLEIASLVGAVGTANGGDAPEAPFLPELPSRQDQPAFSLKSYAAEPVSAPVRMPVSPAYETPLRASPTLVLDVTPAQPPVEVTPLTSQATWRPVPQGYPPVVVSASATLLLDQNEAKLIPLRMGEPLRGGGPVPPPQTSAINTPLLQPRLPSRHGDHSPVSIFPVPPKAPACRAPWEGRIGRGPAVPTVAGILRPQRDVVRLVPPARHANLGTLPSYPFFAAEPDTVTPPKAPELAPASLLDVAIAIQHPVRAEKIRSAADALALPKASNPQTIAADKPLHCEPSVGKVDIPWVESVVASQLPPGTDFAPLIPTGLSLASDPIAPECSSATNLPPSVEAGGPFLNPLPALLLSRWSSLDALCLPFSINSRPVRWDVCRLPSSVSERDSDLGAANLLPALPSPLSLVTWSHSLAVSIPARDPSNLGGPARIELSAIPSRPQPLRPWSPSQRAYRPTPLLPEPAEIGWAPVAPAQTPQRPPIIQAIPPSDAGTAPPRLTLVRVQPASMPVLPPSSGTFEKEPTAGLELLGPSPEQGSGLLGLSRAQSVPMHPASDLRTEYRTLLPALSRDGHAPAAGLAPSSHKIWWGAIAPVETVNVVAPFPALKRLATSLVACLPGPGIAA